MRNADKVFAVMQERGKKGLPVERLYRLLYNKELYLQAYAKLYSNDGAMTPGATTETADGMSIEKIDNIIEAVKYERYQWTPVRRKYIQKANGKQRPLGIPTWSDKLLQEVIRSILEAYYEPQFSPRSHGFRPGRGCHTALTEVQKSWSGVKWIVEGDISSYFDTIDHETLLEILREKIKDNRFISLIQSLLEAGYIEDWKYNKTYSGTPQGGIISPLLANIYLDKLDKHVEVLIKAFNKGTRRAGNSEYRALSYKRAQAKKVGDRKLAHECLKQMRTMPSENQNDPNYRRLKYVRYADDFMLGLIGTKEDAQEIKRQIGEFLKNSLKLKLSEEKTLVTNITQDTARFLGYEITSQKSDSKLTKTESTGIIRRSVNGAIGLRLPRSVIQKKAAQYKRKGKVVHLHHLTENTDFSIVVEYQMKLRGLYQYYALATNVCNLSSLKWVMELSLLKTLANKHKCSAKTMRDKYLVRGNGEIPRHLKVTVVRDKGKEPLTAKFGGFPLTRQPNSTIVDQIPMSFNHSGVRTELLDRFLANECTICGSTEKVEVHHIRKMKDVEGPHNALTDWKRYMASRRRKTLVLCRSCHRLLHAGKPLPALANHQRAG